MKESATKKAMRGLEFLRGLPEELLDQLATISQRTSFPAGGVLFRQGEAATNLHIVVTGRVSLEICAPGVGCKRILTIGPGDLLGWSPILEQGRLTATARAMTASETVQLAGSQVLAICEQNPRFGYEFMQRTAVALSKRLNATRLQLLDVYGSAMPPGHGERAENVDRVSS